MFKTIFDFLGKLKIENKRLENSKELEKFKKHLNKSDGDYINDLIKILGHIDDLKNIMQKSKSGEGIIIQIPGGKTMEIKKINKDDKKKYTDIVNNFQVSFNAWKNEHKDIFLKFNKNTADGFYKIDNFFAHKHSKYSEQDFIKLFYRRNTLMKLLKEEVK